MIAGVGTNDADYPVNPRVSGKIVPCIFYQIWCNMLKRAYCDVAQRAVKNSSYKGCTVVEEWHTFSNFRRWMMGQDWEGNHLDKDLTVRGNREYGPNKCLFIPSEVNLFMGENRKRKYDTPIGVSWHKKGKKYYARCNESGVGTISLGSYDCQFEAASAYRKHKRVLALKLGEKYPSLSTFLNERYAEE